MPADIVNVPSVNSRNLSVRSTAKLITSSHAPTTNTSSPPEYTIEIFLLPDFEMLPYVPFLRIEFM